MKTVRAAIIPVTEFQQNCTLLWDNDTMQAVVIDPGGDLPRLRKAIAETKAKVEKIWLTHGHIDHAGGAAELREELGCRSKARTAPKNFCSATSRRAG